MASRLVDGARIPEFVAGHQALELCNTRAGWGTAEPKEYLTDYRTMLVWARELKLLTPQEEASLQLDAKANPRRAQAIAREARQARTLIYDAATSPHAQSLGALHALVAATIRRSHYVVKLDGHIELDTDLTLRTPLDRAILSAHRFFEADGPATVGHCPGDGCGWLFFDPTGRRRWCIMAVCGNRAKARAFAKRQRDALSSPPGLGTRVS